MTVQVPMPMNVTTFPLIVQYVRFEGKTVIGRPDDDFALAVYVALMSADVGAVDVNVTVCGRSFTVTVCEYDAVPPSRSVTLPRTVRVPATGVGPLGENPVFTTP